MDPTLAIVPVAAAAYLATNLDNFALLMLLLARYPGRTLFVSLGYLSCMAVLTYSAFWIGAAADEMPVEYLGLLGFIPIGIGLKTLIQSGAQNGESDDPAPAGASSVGAVFLATFFTQLGNGADTLVTFGILFADSMAEVDDLIASTVALMASLFVLAGVFGIHRPRVRLWVERYAPRITPWFLIAVGVYVLLNTATDVLPEHPPIAITSR